MSTAAPMADPPPLAGVRPLPQILIVIDEDEPDE
jgi:hypothetical protein